MDVAITARVCYNVSVWSFGRSILDAFGVWGSNYEFCEFGVVVLSFGSCKLDVFGFGVIVVSLDSNYEFCEFGVVVLCFGSC